MDSSTSLYFPHDKQELMTTLTRFDNGVTEDDVVGREKDSDNPQHSYTALIQVLLEFICNAFVKDDAHREKLLNELCRRLSKYKVVNEFLVMEKGHALRIAMKQKVIHFMKQVCKETFPNENMDYSSSLDFFESNLSAYLKDSYYKKFIELDKIGEGGFGVVYKVECNVTKHIYAVKKIVFDYKNDAHFMKVLREANNIAALNHPNIVRYYSAWLEINPDAIRKSPDDIGSSVSSNSGNRFESQTADEFTGIVIRDESVSSFNSYSARIPDANQSFTQNSLGESTDFVVFSESADVPRNVSYTVANESQSCSGNSSNETTNNEYEDEDDDVVDVLAQPVKKHLHVQGKLFIQMEFCDCDLRFWLDKRAERSELPFEMDVTEIFTNILKGVIHIHSKGIIHRDLKPQNIFYSKTSNNLKIGDFGLATLREHQSNLSGHISQLHSTSLGTKPYAAPEQLYSKNYDTEVDIYSLGIILIELMNTCYTMSGLSKVLEEVKQGKITDEMKKFPKLVDLVKNLISENPRERMSAKEILSLLDEDSEKMKEIALKEREELKEEIKSMKSTIIRQQSEIERLNGIIEKLHMKLNG